MLRAERAVLLATPCLAGSRPHEAQHVLGWRLVAGIGAEAIRIGWSARAVCNLVDLPVPARAYRLGVALPGLVLGVAPLLVGLTCGAPWLLGSRFLPSVAAQGYALVLLRLRGVPDWCLVRDHPSRVECTLQSIGWGQDLPMPTAGPSDVRRTDPRLAP